MNDGVQYATDLSFRGRNIPVVLETGNRVDPNMQLRRACRDIGCVEGAFDQEDFLGKAFGIFKKYGFSRFIETRTA